MKRFLATLLCAVMCAAILAGCGPQKEEETTSTVENDAAVVGTWMENDFDSGYVFDANGTGKNIFWDLTFTYTAVDGMITIKYDDESYGTDKFSYSAADNSITMTQKSGEGKSFTYNRK